MKAIAKNKRTLTKKQKRICRIVIIFLILVLCFFAARFALKKMVSGFMGQKQAKAEYTTQTVEKRTIENYLSSSGTVNPLNTYSVTTVSSVEGTILSADFEEGDQVEKGDVLYEISTDGMKSSLASAKKALARAEKDYDNAKSDYADYKKDNSDLTITAEKTGYVKTLYVKAGDSIANNTELLQIYNNKTMLLSVPFNSNDVSSSLIGKKASVILSDTEEALSGKVTAVGSIDEALSGNRIVRYVAIAVENPGGIADGTKASASIGNLYCNDEGAFGLSCDITVPANTAGKIDKIYVSEGDWVEEGDPLFLLSSDSLDEQLNSLSDKVESAKESVEDAQAKLDEVKEGYTDYTITSPISGTIIQKNMKEGDTLNASSMNSTLCLIYDLSAMTFDMYVDELDVHSVKTGQIVNITADALEGIAFEGVITNVSLVSTTSGGVTQYPVTVRIDEPGELLPGMNISGEIIIESAENALAVPADSLMRGNLVYVEDPSVTEETDGVPAGFRSVEVETGISDDEYIEITSGLSEGDAVYVPARSSGNREGMMDMQMPGGEMQGDGMPPGGSSGNGRGGNSGKRGSNNSGAGGFH